MKTFVIFLLFLGLTTTAYSQVETDKAKMKVEELPGVVIKRIGSDFSIYIPDNNPDERIKAIQEKFVAYDLGKEYEEYGEYLVVTSSEVGSLAATYDENGKLIRVVENYKNVKLPSEVIYSVYRTYPEWTIVNDKFLYTQEEGDIIKKQYNLKIKKGDETRKLVVRPNGEILKDK
ncbi:hypothetical protein D3C85_227270 [compost metagenome]